MVFSISVSCFPLDGCFKWHKYLYIYLSSVQFRQRNAKLHFLYSLMHIIFQNFFNSFLLAFYFLHIFLEWNYQLCKLHTSQSYIQRHSRHDTYTYILMCMYEYVRFRYVHFIIYNKRMQIDQHRANTLSQAKNIYKNLILIQLPTVKSLIFILFL